MFPFGANIFPPPETSDAAATARHISQDATSTPPSLLPDTPTIPYRARGEVTSEKFRAVVSSVLTEEEDRVALSE
jgi:hypothetical protein